MSVEAQSRARLVRRELQSAGLGRELGVEVRALLAAFLRDADVGVDWPPRLVIVGPNNAGKSSVFAALACNQLSPVSSLGGTTSKPHGVIGEPWVEALEQKNPEWVVGPSGPGAADWLLVDTPDCDGHKSEHGAVAREVGAWADLLLVVVTPQTYSTEALRLFLVDLVDLGRPWCLVMNVAGDSEVALRQLEALSGQLPTQPAALFWQPMVDAGTVLEPMRLIGGSSGTGLDLLPWLAELSSSESFGTEALKLRRTRQQVLRGELILKLGALRQQTEDIEQALRAELDSIALEVAKGVMPLGVVLDALRSVLDRSSNASQRGFRRGLKALREFGVRQIRRFSARRSQASALRLEDAEREILGLSWTRNSRKLRALGRRAASLDLESARLDQIKGEFAPQRLAEAREELGQGLDAAADLESYRQQVEAMLAEDLSDGRKMQLLQGGMDAMLAMPIALAAVVVFQTGGLGADVVVGGVGALTSVVLEKFAAHLGRGIAERSRQRWTELAQARIGEHLEQLGLPKTLAICNQVAVSTRQLIVALEDLEQSQ
ncbi:MAG TPA: hypothetical protein EYQ25_10440 [Planctomycetes bacterium]|nr:hypothetical protein [Planctomycetota bacterium]HIL38185.1 hypothetical protein [Planctomycetota bacterium]